MVTPGDEVVTSLHLLRLDPLHQYPLKFLQALDLKPYLVSVCPS